jgi:hypothetical protein
MFDPHGDLWGLTRPDAASVLVDAALLSHPDSTAEFWSPDQPRDWHGRWTSGAGGGFAPVARNAERERSRGYVRDFLAGKSTLPGGAERELLAQHLARLTVKELHAIKAEHGLKASAPDKKALVAKLAERFREHREKSARTGQEGLTSQAKGTILPVEAEKPTGVQKMTTQTQQLPRLAGSEKQVAWAESIRDKALPVGHPFGAELRAAAAAHPDARWWIDNKQSPGTELLTEVVRPEMGKTGIDHYNATPFQYGAALWDLARRGLSADKEGRRMQARHVISEGRGNGMLPSSVLGHLERLGFRREEALPLVRESFARPTDPDDDDYDANWDLIAADLARMGGV